MKRSPTVTASRSCHLSSPLPPGSLAGVVTAESVPQEPGASDQAPPLRSYRGKFRVWEITPKGVLHAESFTGTSHLTPTLILERRIPIVSIARMRKQRLLKGK